MPDIEGEREFAVAIMEYLKDKIASETEVTREEQQKHDFTIQGLQKMIQTSEFLPFIGYTLQFSVLLTYNIQKGATDIATSEESTDLEEDQMFPEKDSGRRKQKVQKNEEKENMENKIDQNEENEDLSNQWKQMASLSFYGMQPLVTYQKVRETDRGLEIQSYRTLVPIQVDTPSDDNEEDANTSATSEESRTLEKTSTIVENECEESQEKRERAEEETPIQSAEEDTLTPSDEEKTLTQGDDNTVGIQSEEHDASIQNDETRANMQDNEGETSMQSSEGEANIQRSQDETPIQNTDDKANVKNSEDTPSMENSENEANLQNSEDDSRMPNDKVEASAPSSEDGESMKHSDDEASTQNNENDAHMSDNENDAYISPLEDDAYMSAKEDDSYMSAKEDDSYMSAKEDDSSMSAKEDDSYMSANEDDAAVQNKENPTRMQKSEDVSSSQDIENDSSSQCSEGEPRVQDSGDGEIAKDKLDEKPGNKHSKNQWIYTPSLSFLDTRPVLTYQKMRLMDEAIEIQSHRRFIPLEYYSELPSYSNRKHPDGTSTQGGAENAQETRISSKEEQNRNKRRTETKKQNKNKTGTKTKDIKHKKKTQKPEQSQEEIRNKPPENQWSRHITLHVCGKEAVISYDEVTQTYGVIDSLSGGNVDLSFCAQVKSFLDQFRSKEYTSDENSQDCTKPPQSSSKRSSEESETSYSQHDLKKERIKDKKNKA